MVVSPAVLVADTVGHAYGVAANVWAAPAPAGDLVERKPPILLVLSRFGWPAGNTSVSPLAGIPANPQLALLFQLALAPPPPDQLSVAACEQLIELEANH